MTTDHLNSRWKKIKPVQHSAITSISWLPMHLVLASPGHQQLWYLSCTDELLLAPGEAECLLPTRSQFREMQAYSYSTRKRVPDPSGQITLALKACWKMSHRRLANVSDLPVSVANSMVHLIRLARAFPINLAENLTALLWKKQSMELINAYRKQHSRLFHKHKISIITFPVVHSA